MEKPFFESSASGDSFSISPETLSPRNALNKSYTISKDCYEDRKLTVICEENSECGNDSNMTYLKSFASLTDLSECKNMSFADLGTKQISGSPEFKIEISDNIEEDYDSDESLGLLPDLLEDLTYDSFILKVDLNKDLNSTVNISDKHIGNFEDYLNYDLKNSCEEFLSPVCNKINISDTQAESSAYHNQCMPKHASTPKHENSNVIDEEIASPQNITDSHLNKTSHDHNKEKDCLNKTTIIETGHKSMIANIPTCLNSDENVNSQQNILNTTCNMTNSINTDEISLNKTFESLNILADKYVLPSVICDSEQYKISKLSKLDKTFEHYSAEFDPCLEKENVLNLTCHLDKESDTIGTACGEFSEYAKDSTRDILNTTVSYPSVHDETQLTCSLSKNKSFVNIDQSNFQPRAGDILSTTFEKIEESLEYDANSEKLKCITNLEENKLLQPGTRTVIKKRRTVSFSVRNIAPEKIEFKNESTEFDRNKNMRRSLGSFGKTVTRPNLIKQTSRSSSASSTCSVRKVPEIKKNLSFPKSLPKHAGNIENKISLKHEKKVVNMNSSYLKNKAVECIPLKLSDSKSRNTESVSKIKLKGSQQLLLNTTINFHPTSDVNKTVKCSSKFSNGKSKDIKSISKVNLKGSQESLLNTTINLSPPITDAFKTVVKKPRKSMQISNAVESCLGSCELPFRKDTKSVIPSLQKRVSTKVSLMRVKEMTQEPNENKTSTSSNKFGYKESVSVEQEKISRLPQRTSSQKTKLQSGCQTSSFKPSSNIAKPQTITTGIGPLTTGRKSLFTLAKKSSNEGNELAGKAISKDTVSSQKNKEQDSESNQPPTTGRKIPFTLRKTLNEGSEPAGKAISKETVSSQKNKQQDTGMHKKLQSSTKIPSISHFFQTRKN